MTRDFKFLRKEELRQLTLRDRLVLGLHVSRSVFQYFTEEYVEASCQGPAMRLIEGYLQTGSFDQADFDFIKERWGVFFEQADFGPYQDYGSGWTFSMIALLD